MTHDEAHAVARGYAWGYSDGAAELIKGSTDSQAGVIRFADAYASMNDTYQDSWVGGFMPSVQDAFATWQKTNGQTIVQV